MPIGAYTAASVIVIAMIGPTSSRAALSAASNGFSPSWRCRSTFSTMTIASSTTRPTESTIASSVSRLIVKPTISIRKTAPTSEIGIATTGMSTDAERAEEEEDDDDDDQERLGQRLRAPRRSRPGCTPSSRTGSRPSCRPAAAPGCRASPRAPRLITSSELAVGQDPDAHERGGLAVEADVRLVVLGAEHDVGDLAEAHDDAVLLLDDELAELLGGLAGPCWRRG